MTLRLHHLVLLTLTVVSELATLPAWAQAEFAWQLQGGGVQPVNSYVHSGIRLDTTVMSEQGEEQFVASLVDQYNRFGFLVGTTLLFHPIEIRYDFTFLGWDRIETVCTGSPGAVVLPTGDIDDSTVVYRCAGDGAMTDIRDQDLEAVNLHVISVGYRFYPLRLGELLQPFLVAAPGIALSTYTDQAPEAGLDLGLHLAAGLGVDVGLSQTFTLALEARYSLLFTTPPTRLQDAANRAVARGESSLDAVIEVFHYATFNLGFRLNFR